MADSSSSKEKRDVLADYIEDQVVEKNVDQSETVHGVPPPTAHL